MQTFLPKSMSATKAALIFLELSLDLITLFKEQFEKLLTLLLHVLFVLVDENGF